MDVFVFLTVFSATVCYPSKGFLFSHNTSVGSNDDSSDDIKYLHLLIADERTERLHQQNQLDHQQNEIDRLQTTVDNLSSTLQNVQDQLTRSNTGQSSLVRNVAFRTQLMHDLGQVPKGRVIIFDHVELNLGNAFDKQVGMFIAPYNGTYMFSISLTSGSNLTGILELKVNNKPIEYTFAGSNPGWEKTGIVTVAELKVGDSVWVEGEGYIFGYRTNKLHTGFSGFFISPV